MIRDAERLLNGAAMRTPNPEVAIDLLSRAARKSAEAAFKLGKLYLRGKKV